MFRFLPIIYIFLAFVVCKRPSNAARTPETGAPPVESTKNSWEKTKATILRLLAAADKKGLWQYFHNDVQVAFVMPLEFLAKPQDEEKFLNGDSVTSEILFDDSKTRTNISPALVSFKTAFAKGKQLPDKIEGKTRSLLSQFDSYVYSINATCHSDSCHINQFAIYNSDPEKAAVADQGPY